MRLSLAAYALGLGTIGLSLLSAPSQGTTMPATCFSAPTTTEDTTGAGFHVKRQGEMLRVQGLFLSDSVSAGTLAYKLNVQRTGSGGTSHTMQSGQVDVTPGRTDTLSSVRLNIQPGDQLEMHLSIRRDETVVDEVRRRRNF